MNRRCFILIPAALAIAGASFADDKVRAELSGTAEVEGFDENGFFVDLTVPSHASRTVNGKVEVLARFGKIRRLETYTEWSGPNEVRLKVHEKLYVSGGVFVGWIESNIETLTDKRFSRTVIEGDIEYDIDPDGSGFVEWTAAGERNGVERAEDSDPDEDEDLPTIEISEEGVLDAVFDRRIELRSKNRVTFRSFGYERVLIQNADGTTSEVFLNQDLNLEGGSKGSLSYNPDDIPPDPTPTPSPTPVPTATPSPSATPFPTSTPFDDFSF